MSLDHAKRMGKTKSRNNHCLNTPGTGLACIAEFLALLFRNQRRTCFWEPLAKMVSWRDSDAGAHFSAHPPGLVMGEGCKD